MFQRSPSTSVHPLLAAFVGLVLVACSDPAQSQNVGGVDQSVDSVDMPETPKPYTAAVNMALNLYAALEYCDVGDDRLQKSKQRMIDLATMKMGATEAQFNAAFEAGLPVARKDAQANAAANPAEAKAFCETEREGVN